MPELIWYGKYDEDGKRNGPLRIALPFQTVETVNESAQECPDVPAAQCADQPNAGLAAEGVSLW